MHSSHQIRLINAGFTLFHGENSGASGLHIKVKTKDNHNWHIFEKGFATRVELRKRLHELDKLPKYIDLHDSKNSGFPLQPESAIERIINEVNEQETKHGYTDSFIDNNPHFYAEQELMHAARYCITQMGWPENWDVEAKQKIYRKPLEERLIIAAAFLAREAGRLKRVASKKAEISFAEDLS